MEERIKLIKSRIDGYLDNANKENDSLKKEQWIELAAHWEQYLVKISGIEYRPEDCHLSKV